MTISMRHLFLRTQNKCKKIITIFKEQKVCALVVFIKKSHVFHESVGLKYTP